LSILRETWIVLLGCQQRGSSRDQDRDCQSRFQRDPLHAADIAKSMPRMAPVVNAKRKINEQMFDV
jgi:hypothetical protein